MLQLASLRASLLGWLQGSADNDVLRWLYRGLLAATVIVVALDYADLQKNDAARSIRLPATEQPSAVPLPARQDSRRPPLRPQQPNAKLAAQMTFDLVGNGKLMATGVIMPGTADAFAKEVAKRGAYIKTVLLQSPGGSVSDALAMGRLIRETKFSTEVESGRYCASACPLVFAGGVKRIARSNAAIGVHEVAAFGNGAMSGAAGLQHGQQISAECQHYLRDMGIDLEVWVHAMETPNDQLYYFRPDELLTLKLATDLDDSVRQAMIRR
ncbi:MAG TPA: hypothetical protein VIY68_03890 [Steroidobacteraceae bacterium]